MLPGLFDYQEEEEPCCNGNEILKHDKNGNIPGAGDDFPVELGEFENPIFTVCRVGE